MHQCTKKPVISKRAPNDIRTATAKCHGLFIKVPLVLAVHVLLFFFSLQEGSLWGVLLIFMIFFSKIYVQFRRRRRTECHQPSWSTAGCSALLHLPKVELRATSIISFLTNVPDTRFNRPRVALLPGTRSLLKSRGNKSPVGVPATDFMPLSHKQS